MLLHNNSEGQKSLSTEAKEPQWRVKRALLQRTTYQIKDGKRQTPRVLELLRDRLALLAGRGSRERERNYRRRERERERERARTSERAKVRRDLLKWCQKRPIKVSKETYYSLGRASESENQFFIILNI
jgi:hypothetical protein